MDYTIGGRILNGSDFDVITGYVHVESGRIADIEERSRVKPDSCRATGIIMPALINAHTHLGDSIIKDVPFDSLDILIKPPQGLKHRALRNATARALVKAMQKSLLDASFSGTTMLADFREGGVAGTKTLKTAADSVKNVRVLILGRPGNNQARDYIVEDEIDTILDIAHGIGVSGSRDISGSSLTTMIDKARIRGKFIAIHAGEKDGSDVSSAIELNPDCLIHMTHASKHQIESGIPIVVCPRSNLVTGVGASFSHPPITQMLQETVVGLGTDNVMLNSVNMFAEMEFTAKAFLHDDRKVLEMATLNNARILGVANELGSIDLGKRANLLVINDRSNNLFGIKNVVSSVVRRARPDDIALLTQGG
ncbi:MAG TPA: amidohydrolase family protein [Candidatus Bathyarchaeia archaeon]|nr:amidohydrolase family protein [Candidatus Bathyarchaeia archaeon]